jgi:hypothetical protein
MRCSRWDYNTKKSCLPSPLPVPIPVPRLHSCPQHRAPDPTSKSTSPSLCGLLAHPTHPPTHSPTHSPVPAVVLLPQVFQKKYMEPEEELGAPDGTTGVAHKVEVASFFLMCYGTLTFAALWVLVPGAHALGVEEFSPPDRGVVGSLVVNVLLDAAFNGFLVSGILIASPLVMSVGAMLVRGRTCRGVQPAIPSQFASACACVRALYDHPSL